MIIRLLLLLVGLGVVLFAATKVPQYLVSTRASSFQAVAILGKTESTENGGVVQSNLVPDFSVAGTTLSVPQDEGYFIKFTKDGAPVPSNSAVEVSINTPTGWTAWRQFKNGGVLLLTSSDGLMKIDFADWPKIPVSTIEAKFRQIGLVNESNPIKIANTAVNPEKYFRFFQPGNYWVFKGCQGYRQQDLKDCPTQTYEVRWNVEELQNIAISANGKQFSIASFPLRETNSLNTPTSQVGRLENYTTFLSSNYGNFSGLSSKWVLKSVFYERNGSFYNLTQNQHRTAIFLPNTSWPPYFYASNPLDLFPPNAGSYYDRTFDTFVTEDTTFKQGDISQLTGSKTGWKTDYKVIKVNYPKFRGRLLRVSFLEYGASNGQTSASTTVWNHDEWLFSENIGFVGINNEISRGTTPCSQVPDCTEANDLIQNPGYSISLDDYMILDQKSPMELSVSLNKDFLARQKTATITPGQTYFLVLNDARGKPYTGPVEVYDGIYSTPDGSRRVPFGRQVFVDINRQPVWAEKGIAPVATGINQAKGDYKVRVRPLILSSNSQMGTNSLLPSNEVTVFYR